ncbi:hypothetical protein F4604DRAFT_1915405 [Suillus subluteus]|nr:hypothetical protein F4604DRAFT_1915405 [Suillus subluteus]
MLMGSSEEEIHLPTAGAHQGGARGMSLALGTPLVALTLPFLHVRLPARIDTLFEVSSLGVAYALPTVREDRHPALGDKFIAETSKLTSQAHQILWPESAVVFNSQEEGNYIRRYAQGCPEICHQDYVRGIRPSRSVKPQWISHEVS